MIKLLVVRHAQAEGNDERRFIGQLDVPLTAVGRNQVRMLTRRLVRYPISRVVASDLQRAIDTISPVASQLGLEVTTDKRLREVANGEWAGLLGPEIAAKWPDMWQAYRSGEDVARPGGESWADVQRRVRELVSELLGAAGDGETILVGTHAGPALGVVRWALGLPPNGNVFAGPFGDLDNTSITTVTTPGPTLVAFNDVGHLPGAALKSLARPLD